MSYTSVHLDGASCVGFCHPRLIDSIEKHNMTKQCGCLFVGFAIDPGRFQVHDLLSCLLSCSFLCQQNAAVDIYCVNAAECIMLHYAYLISCRLVISYFISLADYAKGSTALHSNG